MEQKKRGKSKEIALELLKILEEHTDKEHLLSKEELIQKHYEDYRADDGEDEIQAKTFYSKIDELEAAGFPIKRTKGKWTRYYLDDARLSKDELLFLICMIKGSPDLAEEEAETLTGKLLSMRVHKRAAKFVGKSALPVAEKPSPVRQIPKFAVLLEAAQKGRRVSCKFILSREGGYRFSERRIVSPRAIEFTREGARVTLLDGGVTKYVPLCDLIDVELEKKS